MDFTPTGTTVLALDVDAAAAAADPREFLTVVLPLRGVPSVIDDKGPGISSLPLLLDLEADTLRGTGTFVPSNGDLVLAGDGVPFPIFTLIGITGVGGSSGFAFGFGIFFGCITGVGSPLLISFLGADLDLGARGVGRCGAKYIVSGDTSIGAGCGAGDVDTSIGAGDVAAAAADAPPPPAIVCHTTSVIPFKLLSACC